MKTGFFIKNILVISQPYGQRGEFRGSNNETLGNRVDRMVGQFRSLANCAVNYHHPQRLTRVITDEFSFFTYNTPLSIEEYKELINKASDALKFCPPNMVLILSSIPVLWPDGSLRNAVLHIQSPNSQDSEPIIHHFSKKSWSSNDPWYYKNPSHKTGDFDDIYKYKPDDYDSLEYSPDIVLQTTKVKCSDPNQYKSAIIVQGQNIPPIIETIDVCLDHDTKEAKRNASLLLKRVNNPPFHISHIVTSNSIFIIQKHLASGVVHADQSLRKIEEALTKREVLLSPSFGNGSTAFIYSAVRPGIIHSKLFQIALNKINIPIQDFVDTDGNTLLHELFFQSKNKNPQCVHYKKRLKNLLCHFDENAINKQNKDGNTPLHLAITTTHDKNILIDLLERGARLDIKNNDGMTVIEMAYAKTYAKTFAKAYGKNIKNLCNKLSNNRKIYATHRQNILTIISEIKDAYSFRRKRCIPLKRNLICASLCFELSEPQPNIQIIMELMDLLEASNTLMPFIKNNFHRLACLACEYHDLYSYLRGKNAFSYDKVGIYPLPRHCKLELLKQELRSELIQEDTVRFFLHHQELLDDTSNYETLLVEYGICPNGLGHLNVNQKSIVHACLSMNIEEISKLLAEDHNIAQVIEDVFHPKLVGSMTKEIYTQWVKNELRKGQEGQNANHELIIFILSQGREVWGQPYSEDFTIAEQALVQAYKSKNRNLLKAIYQELKKEGLSIYDYGHKLAQAISSPQAPPQQNRENIQKVINWFDQELVKIDPIHIIKKEFKKGQQFPFIVDPTLICTALLEGVNLEEDCGLNNGLTVGEQALTLLISALPMRAEEYRVLFSTLSTQFNPEKIEKVANTCPLKDKASSSIYERWVINELNKGREHQNINIDVIITALSQYKELGTKLYDGGLTIAEQAVAQAFMSDNMCLFNTVYQKMKNENLLIDMVKIAESFGSNKAIVSCWIDQKLCTLEPQFAIKYELKKFSSASVINILSALSKGVNLNEQLGLLFNDLTIGEQLIAQAWISYKSGVERTLILALLDKVITPLDENKISKIVSSFNPTDQATVNTWIYRELLQNEIKKGKNASAQNILAAIAQGTTVCNGLYEYGPLTLSDMAVRVAYELNNPIILYRVYSELKKENINIDIDKIARIRYSFDEEIHLENISKVKNWIRQELSRPLNIMSSNEQIEALCDGDNDFYDYDPPQI